MALGMLGAASSVLLTGGASAAAAAPAAFASAAQEDGTPQHGDDSGEHGSAEYGSGEYGSGDGYGYSYYEYEDGSGYGSSWHYEPHDPIEADPMESSWVDDQSQPPAIDWSAPDTHEAQSDVPLDEAGVPGDDESFTPSAEEVDLTCEPGSIYVNSTHDQNGMAFDDFRVVSNPPVLCDLNTVGQGWE